MHERVDDDGRWCSDDGETWMLLEPSPAWYDRQPEVAAPPEPVATVPFAAVASAQAGLAECQDLPAVLDVLASFLSALSPG